MSMCHGSWSTWWQLDILQKWARCSNYKVTLPQGWLVKNVYLPRVVVHKMTERKHEARVCNLPHAHLMEILKKSAIPSFHIVASAASWYLGHLRICTCSDSAANSKSKSHPTILSTHRKTHKQSHTHRYTHTHTIFLWLGLCVHKPCLRICTSSNRAASSKRY